jgi:hypothetical protein
MSNITTAQGFGYNELKPKTNNPQEILDIANRKALYIQMLIDAVNINGDPLSTVMDDYLNAASNIVFLDPNASLKDVVKCLNNYEYRKTCINNIPPQLKESLEDNIDTLHDLDALDKDKKTTIGTKDSKIEGINHRINVLKKDMRLKFMFNKSCADNIDIVKAMDEGKIILVRMPQEYFATPYSKNVIVTYWFTKLWCATLVRGGREPQPKRFHVIVDEIFQAKTTMLMLHDQEILPQTRKFGLRMVYSAQNLSQLSIIDETLYSAGASYMFLKGSSNYNQFKEELEPYKLEDIETLPKYSSLNLIYYDDDS